MVWLGLVETVVDRLVGRACRLSLISIEGEGVRSSGCCLGGSLSGVRVWCAGSGIVVVVMRKSVRAVPLSAKNCVVG